MIYKNVLFSPVIYAYSFHRFPRKLRKISAKKEEDREEEDGVEKRKKKTMTTTQNFECIESYALYFNGKEASHLRGALT